MGIFELVNQLKTKALSLSMCSGSDYGDISLYEDKEVTYPFINIDIVSSNVTNNGSKRYTFRIYSMDRNVPYIAYNKAELLLNDFMNEFGVYNYTLNFFTLEFNDLINGVFADITIDVKMDLVCAPVYDSEYIILENGDYFAKYLLNESGGKFPIDN